MFYAYKINLIQLIFQNMHGHVNGGFNCSGSGKGEGSVKIT